MHGEADSRGDVVEVPIRVQERCVGVEGAQRDQQVREPARCDAALPTGPVEARGSLEIGDPPKG